MGIRSTLAKALAWYVQQETAAWANRPVDTQKRVFNQLISRAKNTAFGKDHGFDSIRSHADFVKKVPIRDYEQLRSYFDRTANGEADILWAGKPLYLAKTSGTTSGAKFIPITRESIPNHINGARNALLRYVYETGKSKFLDGKLIFLSGSPVMEKKNGIHSNTNRYY